jgi:serine/threonine protein phosphatase PrpC
MGVFDGHGEYGDYCSHFAADQVGIFFILDIDIIAESRTGPNTP